MKPQPTRAGVSLFYQTPGLPWSQNIITPRPIGELSIVMSVSVCVSVCVCWSVRDHVFGTTPPISIKLFVPVTYGRDSVLLWRHSDMLCILWMTSYLHIS